MLTNEIKLILMCHDAMCFFTFPKDHMKNFPFYNFLSVSSVPSFVSIYFFSSSVQGNIK